MSVSFIFDKDLENAIWVPDDIKQLGGLILWMDHCLSALSIKSA